MNVRFGVMLVGPTGGGKSTCYKTLAGALTRLRAQLAHPNTRYQVVQLALTVCMGAHGITWTQQPCASCALWHESCLAIRFGITSVLASWDAPHAIQLGCMPYGCR